MRHGYCKSENGRWRLAAGGWPAATQAFHSFASTGAKLAAAASLPGKASRVAPLPPHASTRLMPPMHPPPQSAVTALSVRVIQSFGDHLCGVCIYILLVRNLSTTAKKSELMRMHFLITVYVC